MKNISTNVVAFSALLLASAGVSLAASLVLTNGGLGQAAANPTQFGVAICNNGSQALSASVPVAVAVSGQSATVSSPSSIAAGQCGYTYLNYSQFGMTSGQTYSVNVTIDPQHTVTSGANNTSSYSVTVPGQTTADANNQNLTADASANVSSNPLVIFWHWLISLF